MSIDLSPQTVAMIEQKMQTGQFESVDELLQSALESVDSNDEFTLTEEEMQESLTLIEQAAADHAAGKTISHDEWRKHMDEKVRKLMQ
jgi:Arc/MetJ-type ribon-helix-helix transcriptional regulator